MNLPPDVERRVLDMAAEQGEPVKVTEKQFMAQVVAFARRQGWLVYHTHNSRRSEPGFPDLLMLKGLRMVVAELKVGKNECTPAQRTWIAAFMNANVSTFVWRPEDWGQIEKVLGDQ